MLRRLNKLFTFVWTHPLNRRAPFLAIGRVIRWQIASRLLVGPIALPFINGTYLFATRGMTGATGNYYCGLQEYEDMSFVLHFLKPNDLFVDVGANIGSYSILAAAGGASVIAVEPIPNTFETLKRNVVLNKLQDHIECLNIGLGAESKELLFSSDRDTTNHVVVEGENTTGTVTVPVARLDDVLGSEVPTLIKIDVEGFETQVIEGAQKTLSNLNLLAVIMELNGSGDRYGFDENHLHKKMLDFGFSTYCYQPSKRQLISKNGERNHVGNTLYLRSDDEILTRISVENKMIKRIAV